MNEELIVEKYSDTEVKITKPTPVEVVDDIRSKTDTMARIEFVKQSKSDTEKILAERIQSFDKEIEELQIILNQMDIAGIKTDYELSEEKRVESESVAKEVTHEYDVKMDQS